MADRDAKIEQFCAVAGCDEEFAASFLDGASWNLEAAINNFLGGGNMDGSLGGSNMDTGGAGGAGGVGGDPTLAGFGDFIDEPLERAPIAQFKDTLIDMDPAARVPQRAPPAAATNHPLEAFRDFRKEGEAAGSADGEPREVFGLPKRPRNLAEIYQAPTFGFVGTFDQLREAGKAQSRWIIVNIQSPTEFASQQLNADTWRDETLVAVIGASFLFWQQYHDSPDGGTYCRFYLPNAPAGLPHIGILDPVTGQLVKSWTGFKDAERLMDKLMEYADMPPCPPPIDDDAAPMPQAALSPLRSSAAGGAGGGGGTAGGNDGTEDAMLAAAIAASQAAAPPPAPLVPAGPTDAEVDALWGPPPPAVEVGGTLLKFRLPEGQFTRRFLPEHTLRDVFRAIHHESGTRLDPSKAYKLAAPYAEPMVAYDTSLAELKAGGAYNLAEA